MRLILLSVLASLTVGLMAVSPSAALTGDIAIHDPTMIEADGCYYAFSTSYAISIRKTCDLTTDWTNIGNVFGLTPGWIKDVIGHTPQDLWAPDINFFNDKYYLYYAGSSFGSNTAPNMARATTRIASPTQRFRKRRKGTGRVSRP